MLAFIMAVPSGQSGRQDDIMEMYLSKISEKDREALALLYEKTHAAVYGLALSILKNKQDAEDVTHDTYVQIWKAAASYQSAGKPLAWIFTITRNLARMRMREQKRTVTVAPQDWQDMFADVPSVGHEDRMVLQFLMEGLSDEEQQIVLLHAMTGLKHREIAELLHLGLPTVLSKYSRALKKMRNALKEVD